MHDPYSKPKLLEYEGSILKKKNEVNDAESLHYFPFQSSVSDENYRMIKKL